MNDNPNQTNTANVTETNEKNNTNNNSNNNNQGGGRQNHGKKIITPETKPFMESLKDAYSTKEKFIEAALECSTAGLEARSHDWFRKYPYGIFVTEFRFSSEVLKKRPFECFMRAILADASLCEGKGRDIFKGVPHAERGKYLEEKIIGEYIFLPELRLKEADKTEFMKQFGFYTTTNGINTDKREKNFLKILNSDLPNADVYEIGGTSENDYLYYCTVKNNAYIINFGEWKASEETKKK